MKEDEVEWNRQRFMCKTVLRHSKFHEWFQEWHAEEAMPANSWPTGRETWFPHPFHGSMVLVMIPFKITEIDQENRSYISEIFIFFNVDINRKNLESLNGSLILIQMTRSIIHWYFFPDGQTKIEEKEVDEKCRTWTERSRNSHTEFNREISSNASKFQNVHGITTSFL